MLKPMKMIETNTLHELNQELDLLQIEYDTTPPHDYETKRDINYAIAYVQWRIEHFEEHIG